VREREGGITRIQARKQYSVNYKSRCDMNVDHVFVISLIEDNDNMVLHSAQGLFYKNVMKTGARKVDWYDLPIHDVPQLRLSYTPGLGFKEKILQFDVGNSIDTSWATKISEDFENKFKIKHSGNDFPTLPHGKIATIGAIIVCHTHLNTYTLTAHYTPEQLASRLANAFDQTFRMISFNACEVAKRHDTNPKYLKKNDAESWTYKEAELTPEEKEKKLADYFEKQFPGGSKQHKTATPSYMKKNHPGWDKKRSFIDHDGSVEIEMNEFTIVSRFLRQYVKDKNCSERVMVAGYDESITAAHPDKKVGGQVSAKKNDDIGRRMSMAGTMMRGSKKKRYFLAVNGNTGITMRVSDQSEWHELFRLPVENVDQ
jgi:hypothetical protein